MGQVILSVLIPARNASATIDAAVASMQAQTIRDLEIVVVDDGSTDDTAVRVAAAAGRDARVRLIKTPAMGLVPALNLAITAARAPWLARMDADDVAHPERLEHQMQLSDSADIIGCGVRIVGGGDGYARYGAWLNGLCDHDSILRERFIESPMAHPTVLMRRTTAEGLSGYRDMGWPEDYDLWLRAAAAGARFAKVQRMLLDWTDRADRTSRQDVRYHEEAFYACKAHHLARGPLSGGRCTIWGAGPVGTRLARALRKEGVTVSRFIDIDAKKIGSVRGGSPIVGMDELDGDADAPLLAAVAARGARDLVRTELSARGFVEGRDFWCVA
jgi:glycosyltransferase involved in cell wall biosynthesis